MALKTSCPACGKDVHHDGGPRFACPHCKTEHPNPVPLRRDSDETIELPASSGSTLGRKVPLLKGPAPRADPAREDGEALPRRLGNYELLEVLGRGGMGLVYRARHVGLDRLVALKLIRGADPATGDLVRFVAEAQVTGQIEHPNIVPVHEIGSDEEGRPFFVMKLVRGHSLGEILSGLRRREAQVVEDYPLPRLLAIFCEVCQAVAFAHSKGVLHRDLKPTNVMIGDFGEVQVMDWGLAKKFGEPETRTAGLVAHGPKAELRPIVSSSERVKTVADAHPHSRPGSVAGTPEYMSPEQAAGEPEALSPRSDVYSLGAILYEILNYRPPHMDADTRVLMRKVATEPVVFPHRAAVPKALRAIAIKALALRQEDRYSGVLGLLKDVRAFLEDQPVAAAPDTLPDRVARLVRRHGALLGTATAALILLSLGSALAFWRLETATQNELKMAQNLAQEKEVAAQEARARTAAEETARKAAEDTTKALREKSDADYKRLAQALRYKEAVKVLQEAEELARRRQYEKAIRLLEELLEKQPDTELMPVLCFACGDAYRRIGGREAAGKAIEYLFKAHRYAQAAGKGDPRALLNCGEVAWKLLDDIPKALDYFRQANRADPQDPYGILGLAYAHVLSAKDETDPLVRREHAQNALDDANRATASRDFLWEAHFLAGKILAGLELPSEDLLDLREARERLSRAVDLEPGLPEIWLARAEVCRNLGDKIAALADYDSVLRLQPRSVAAFAGRSALNAELGRRSDALRDLEDLVRLAPDDPDAHFRQGTVLLADGNAREAEKAFGETLRLRPNFPKASLLRGRARFIQGKFKVAIEDAERAYTAGNADLDALKLRADARLKINDPSTASDYETLLKLVPSDSSNFLGLAEARIPQGREEEAVASYLQYLKREPKRLDIWVTVVRLQMRIPEGVEGALQTAKEAEAQAQGNDPKVKCALAEALLAANHVREAQETIEDAFTRFRTDPEVIKVHERIGKQSGDRRR